LASLGLLAAGKSEPIEQQLAELQSEQHLLESRLSTPLTPQEMAAIGERLQRIGEERAGHEDRWLRLSEQLDAAERPA
ncbi:MAG TPA: hypothetical protein PKY22_12805, partial [Accumulibacter sp.]|nr:hypothetical protein [Accumulibacter sp.]